MKPKEIKRNAKTVTFSLPKELAKWLEDYVSKRGEYATKSHWLRRQVELLKEDKCPKIETQPMLAGFAE